MLQSRRSLFPHQSHCFYGGIKLLPADVPQSFQNRTACLLMVVAEAWARVMLAAHGETPAQSET
jgi:hypothetical protein